MAAGTALSALEGIVQTALARYRGLPETIQSVPAFEIRQHRRYNPAAITSLNIVPGLPGTILTMTMLIFTALWVTREIERGTMESLLSMPINPLEVMLGKIIPYIFIGFLQAALILLFAVTLFGVPVTGSMLLLALPCLVLVELAEVFAWVHDRRKSRVESLEFPGLTQEEVAAYGLDRPLGEPMDRHSGRNQAGS